MIGRIEQFTREKNRSDRYFSAGVLLLMAVSILLFTGSAPALAAQTTPPPYTHAWYVNNPDTNDHGVMWWRGYNDGARDSTSCTNALAVLDFGQVGYEAGGSYGGYGTYDFAYGYPFISDGTIEAATEMYASGWYQATSACPRLKVVIGTNNYHQCPYGGACSPNTAGQQWGNVVNSVQTWLNNNGVAWQITAWAGDDMEQSAGNGGYDCGSQGSPTRSFVDGFNSNNPANDLFLDFGTAWVPVPADGSCWSAADVQYVAFVATADWPLPEIYFGQATDSWVNVRRQYLMWFLGVMTTCNQDDPITGNTCTFPSGWFTPTSAWWDLWNKLNQYQVGQSSLNYATNIRYQR
ncbi:MAG: hypothetical protein KGJ80_05325 [Chloroflexota bacterium]|nr:hypothetical protein [Chloroflexota bacterium]